MKAKAVNKLFINKKGYVETVYNGDQTEEDLKEMMDGYENLGVTKSKSKKPFKFLIDITKLRNTDLAARQVAVEILKKINVEKMALFGGSLFIRSIVNLVLSAVGDWPNARHFKERKEAEDWLEK